MWRNVLLTNSLRLISARTSLFSPLHHAGVAPLTTLARASSRFWVPKSTPIGAIRGAATAGAQTVLKYDGQVTQAMDGVASISFGAKELARVHIGEKVFFFKSVAPTEVHRTTEGQKTSTTPSPIPTQSVQDAGDAGSILRAVGLVFNVSEAEVTAVIVEDVNSIVTQGTFVALGNELPSIFVGFDYLAAVTDSVGTNAFTEHSLDEGDHGKTGGEKSLKSVLFSEVVRRVGEDFTRLPSVQKRLRIRVGQAWESIWEKEKVKPKSPSSFVRQLKEATRSGKMTEADYKKVMDSLTNRLQNELRRKRV